MEEATFLKNKLLAYAPFILGAVVIICLQMMLLTIQQIKPFPEALGRETKLTTLASSSDAAQPVGPNEFVYLSGDSLAYVSLDEAGNSTIAQRPLPSPDLRGSYPYRLFRDRAFWVGSDQRIYTSEWRQDQWTPKRLLNDKETKALDVSSNKEGYFLIWSDLAAVYAGNLAKEEQVAWSSYPFSNVTKLQAAVNEQGNLSAAVVSEQVASSDFYVLRLNSALQIEQQARVKNLVLPDFNRLDDIAIGQSKSTTYLFYTVSSIKSGKSFLNKLSMPTGTLAAVSEEQVKVLSMQGRDSDTVLHPYILPGQNDELQAVITSFYEKDRRFAHQEPYLLTFKEGIKVKEQRLSGFRGFAEHPMLFVNDKGNKQAVWLNRKDESSFEVLYATDQPSYVKRKNVATREDQVESLKNLPLFWGIGLLTILISLKWIALPFLYLLIMISVRERHLISHASQHMGILIGMYALVKILTISDFKKPIALELMPDYMQQGYFAYLLLAVVLFISWGWTQIWRRRLDERNPLKEFAYMAMLDIFLTTLWYSYFLSPAHL
jgi:hypothetical protein